MKSLNFYLFIFDFCPIFSKLYELYKLDKPYELIHSELPEFLRDLAGVLFRASLV